MLTPLRKARLKANMTIQQVCAEIECDPGNLSRMERGIQRPTPQIAERLARLFAPDLSEVHILYPERFVEEGPAYDPRNLHP